MKSHILFWGAALFVLAASQQNALGQYDYNSPDSAPAYEYEYSYSSEETVPADAGLETIPAESGAYLEEPIAAAPGSRPLAFVYYPESQFSNTDFSSSMLPGPPVMNAGHSNYQLPGNGAPIMQTSLAESLIDDGGKDESGLDCCGWDHCYFTFGEFLYLRARDSEVAYAVELDGPIVAPPAAGVQVGPVGVVDQDYDAGFRAGVGMTLDDVSSLSVQFTMFETSRFNQTFPTSGIGGTVIRSLVTNPATWNAAQDDLAASARHDITYDLIDVDYRELWSCSDRHELTWLLGIRYANLEQGFDSSFGVLGNETVVTDIDFDGLGVRFGLEGERYHSCRPIFFYAKGYISFIAGEFRTTYDQADQFDALISSTSWQAGRIVTTLDLELGAGWISPCENWRLSAGYVFSAWYNTVKTNEWIDAVQRNNFVGLGDKMTFDGLQARVEYRW